MFDCVQQDQLFTFEILSTDEAIFTNSGSITFRSHSACLYVEESQIMFFRNCQADWENS